mmetsp:Transcript_4546/g.14230  ORF Transcript_4546/g.14230 Transcript_4546/m.14230 type:complete len:200 (-) Transcript_4546:149-748(-)
MLTHAETSQILYSCKPRRKAPTKLLEAGLDLYRRCDEAYPDRKHPRYAALPEPITVAPEPESSGVCDFLDMRYLVVSCGRKCITRNSKVLIYPFATKTDAQRQYNRLSWSSRLLADVTWCGHVNSHKHEVLSEWWRLDVPDPFGYRRIDLLCKTCERWSVKMTQRELDRRSGRIPAGNGESATCADDVELTCLSDRSIS